MTSCSDLEVACRQGWLWLDMGTLLTYLLVCLHTQVMCRGSNRWGKFWYSDFAHPLSLSCGYSDTFGWAGTQYKSGGVPLKSAAKLFHCDYFSKVLDSIAMYSMAEPDIDIKTGSTDSNSSKNNFYLLMENVIRMNGNLKLVFMRMSPISVSTWNCRRCTDSKPVRPRWSWGFFFSIWHMPNIVKLVLFP